MTTQYTSILKLALPVQGELSGTWGDVVNDNITSMVEEAVAGRAVIDTWTTNSHTLTTADGTTSEARCAMLEFTDTGAALTGAATVVCPSASKLYVCKNDSGQQVTIQTAAGTGVAIPDGQTMFVFCDGTNVEQCETNFNSLSYNGYTLNFGGAVTTAGAFTTSGAYALTLTTTGATDVTLPTTGTLATLDGTETLTNKTLTAPTISSPTLTGSISATDLTISGNTTIGDASADTLTVNSTITSNLIFTDDTYDIGATGATRPRDLFLSRNAVLGGTLTTTGNVTLGADTNNVGSFSINTDKFTVSSATGNTLVAGTLGVTGITTATGGLNVDTISEITAAGGVTVDGVLLKDGGATLTGDLTVDTNTLYVDSANNRVGIGESSPTAELHITDSAANAVIRLESSDSGESVINFDDTTAGVGQIVYDHTADRMEFGTAANATNTFLDSNQTLILGADTAQNYPVIGSTVTKGRIQILESDITAASMLGARYSTVTNGFQMTLAHSKTNTIGDQTALADGDNAGRILFAGSDGTNFLNLAGIEADNEGTPSTGSVSGSLSFLTTQNGNTPGPRMKIFSSGRVSLGPVISDPSSFGTLFVYQNGGTASDGFAVYNNTSGSSMRMYVDNTSPNAERVLTSGTTKMIATDGSTNLKLYTNSGSQFLTLTTAEQAILSSISTVSYSTGNLSATLQLRETDPSAAISVGRLNNDANGPYHVFTKSRSSTPGVYSIVSDGDYLGTVRWTADDGVDFNPVAAEIYARVDGTPGADDMPGELVFATTRSGFNSTTDRMKINEGGKVIVGSGAQQRSTEIWQTGGGKTDAFFVEGLNSTSVPWGGITITMNNTADDFGPTLTFVRTQGTSVGSNAAVTDGDVVGAINFNAADGTDVRSTAASILSEIDGTPGADDTPGKLRFLTTQSGNDYPSQALTITSGQRVVVSTAAPMSGTQYITGGAYFANEGSSAASGSMQNYRFVSAGNPAYFVIGSSRGSSTIRTASSSGDDLGRIVFLGDDGSAFNPTAAYIGVTAVEAFTTGSTPGYLRFYTTASGFTNPGERFTIKSDETIVYNNNLRLSINSGNAPGVIRFDDTDTAVASAQVLGKIVGTSDDAQRVGDVAEIQFQYQDSSPDANILFKTYYNGTSDYSERWRISYNGTLTNTQSTGTTSNINMKSGTGIIFNAASGTENALEYYEEGNWTPAFSNAFLEGAFSAATGFGSVTGRYIRVGAQVTCWANIESITGSSGNLVGDDNFSFTRASLPYAPTNDGTTFDQNNGFLTVYNAVGTGTNASGPIICLNANAAVVVQVTAIANTVLSTNSRYQITLIYKTNA